MPKAITLAALLLACSCTRSHSVQIVPPISVPSGFVSGYGVEKITGGPTRARQAAYLKAMDDLLTHSGPVLVSKTVRDQMTVIDVKSPSHVLETTFRLRASRMLQPTFERSGVDHGFVWVLLATTEEDIENGWQQFIAWRTERIDQARKLFQEANGLQRVQFLKASLAMLEDAGGADEPDMLYYQVKAALDTENGRLERFENFQKEFRTLADNGHLDAAEAELEQAQRVGLDQSTYQKCVNELSERRAQAMQLIQAGDDLLRSENYKQARIRYEQARRIDRNNSLVESKIAMVDRYEHEARARNRQAVIGVAIPAATRTLTEYFEFKREQERRKLEEERRRREEEERAAEEERIRQEEARLRRYPRRDGRP